MPYKDKEKSKFIIRKWAEEHPIYFKEYRKKYLSKHPEYWKRYFQTAKGKLLRKNIDAKRGAIRKQLGFIPLNNCFDGLHGHHIDTTRIIYIPKEMHEDIRHSLLRNRKMEEINYHAFLHLEAEELYSQFV